MTSEPDIARYSHAHNFLGSSHDENARRTLWVVALTVVMMVGEIIAGYLTGSMALLADGFHMATHAGALGVAAAAYAYARRHVGNPAFSFGTGKVGDLAGFASALVLALIALGIGAESALRLFQPITVAFGEATIIAVVGLLVNIASAALLAGSHGHSHYHDHGEHHGHNPDRERGRVHDGNAAHADNNLRSAYMHVLADALTSVLAIVALLAGGYLGWAWLDPVMGIVGAIVIGRWSWSLIKDTACVLLDRTDAHVADEIREEIEGPCDARITDLHVWKVGPEAHAAIIGVVVTNPAVDTTELRRRLLPVHELQHVTIERH